MIRAITFLSILSFFLFLACSEDKFPLPTPNTQDNAFGANDTNYVELSPIWNASTLGYTFSSPHDMTVGLDGIIYVADTDNNRVVAMSKAGAILQHDGLGELDKVMHPTGVSVDSKLNVLISNQSDTVYCWNQYLNSTGIDSIAESCRFLDSSTNEVMEMTFTEYIARVAAGGSELQIIKILFQKNDALAEQVRDVYPIYVADEAEAQINCVAAGQYGSGLFYITESAFDKITQIQLVPEIAVKMYNRAILFRYRGIAVRDIAQYGSGAGTVDDPWAIKVDGDGNIYFTQLGGNFRVQKLNYPNFDPAYVLGVHDIMDLERFAAPMDVELDDENSIFVIDAEKQLVSKFQNAGPRAGQEAYLGKKGLATAEFQAAQSLVAVDNIVYVLESGLNRIRRYQYSISGDDVPDDDKQP